MPLIGYVVVGLIAVALLRVAVQIVAVVGLALLIWLAATKPREVAAFIFMLIILGLIGRYPVAGLAIFGLLALAGLRGPRG